MQTPSCNHQIKFYNIYRRLGGDRRVNQIQDFELETQLIYGNFIIPGVSLKYAGKKPLGEKQATNPVAIRIPIFKPGGHEIDSLIKVLNPTGKGFETRICDGLPTLRHLIVNETVVHGIKFLNHDHQPLNGQNQILRKHPHLIKQSVESRHFL